MVYSKVVKEYVKVRAEQTENNTMIAREVKAKFNPPQELDKVRRWISYFRKRLKIKAKQQPIKRLFFDIETSYYTCRLWHIGKMDYVSPETIISQKQIICIAYKWQHEDDVHILDWTMGEKEMLKAFVEVLAEASEIIGHNCNKFDLKELRTRCIYYGLPMFPTYRTLDTLLKSREYFSFASNKLDYIGKYLQVGKKLDHTGFQLWIDVVEKKDPDALKLMKDYCITPDHKLLKSDMKWYEARDLKVGDEVLGFDEYSSMSNRRRFRKSIIEKIKYDIAPVYEVKLSSGKIFKVTADHLWLVKDGNKYIWRRTDRLLHNEEFPSKISKVLDMWEEVDTKEAGWLAGMFDGEGCLSFRGSPTINGKRAITSLTISQRPGTVLTKIETLLKNYSNLYSNRLTKKDSNCVTLGIYGFKYQKLKILGEIRPERLLQKIDFDCLGSFEARAGDETVVSVTPIGEKEIIKIQTNTGTFICDGYAHHNCIQDVVLLEDVYTVLSPYITHNNNFAVLTGGEKWECPECASNNVVLSHTYATAMGTIKRNMKCNACGKQYKISNKSYMKMLEESMK
jgi:hypothetical protein